MSVSMKIDIPDQAIDDILSSAFDGGIAYWCESANVGNRDYKGAEFASQAVSRGAVIDLKVYEGEEAPNPKPLDRSAIEIGIVRAAEHCHKSVSAFIDNHDAGDADVAVQLAVFGEVIFG